MMKVSLSPTATTNQVQDFENDRKRLTSIDRLIGNFFDIVGLDDISGDISEGGGKSKEFTTNTTNTTTNTTCSVATNCNSSSSNCNSSVEKQVKVFAPIHEHSIHVATYHNNNNTPPRRSKRPNNNIISEPEAQPQIQLQLHQQRISLLSRTNSSDDLMFFPKKSESSKFSIRQFMQRRKSHYGGTMDTTNNDNEILNQSRHRKDDVCWYPANKNIKYSGSL